MTPSPLVESWQDPWPEGWEENMLRAPTSAGDGSEVICRVWKKGGAVVSDAKRVLLISHGIGEHGGRYRHFPHHLQGSFDEIWVPDHFAHGLSQGKKGDVPHFEVFVDDLRRWVSLIQEKNDQARLSLHLFGHSMGGLIGIRLLERYPEVPFKTATFSSPYLGLVAPVPQIKKLASKLFLKLYPSLILKTGLDAEGLSRNPKVVEAYLADPLVHGFISPRFFETMMESQAAANAAAPVIGKRGLAMLFVLPKKDRLVAAPAAHAFFESLNSPHARMVWLEESYHECFNDLDREQGFHEWVRFLKEKS